VCLCVCVSVSVSVGVHVCSCVHVCVHVCVEMGLGCLKALGACTRGKESMLSFRCFVCRQSKQQLEEEEKKALYGLENAGNH
jgi:hypothetical protein